VNIITLPKYLRLTPFDTSSEQGRSDERYRLAALSTFANVLSRAVHMLVMVLTVSLTIPYLGAERFGVWMTIASLAGMLTFLDLGVGNALTSKVAKVAAQKNPTALRETISGGLGFLFFLGCVIGGLLYCLANRLPWHSLIKLNDVSLHVELLNAVTVFSVLFGFNLFTNGIQRIFAGLQRSFESHFVNMVGSCLSLFILWIAARGEVSIPYLLTATLGIQSLANVNLLFLLAKRNLFTFKSILSQAFSEAQHLLHIGGLFFLLQIGTMVGYGADSLIISSTLGAAHVAAFNIIQRLFQVISQPMNILNAPLWAAYADAHIRGEKQFIRKTLKMSLTCTGVYCFLSVMFMSLVGEHLVKIWTGNEVKISQILLFAYGGWATLDAIGNALGMFLNGCSVIKQQVLTVIIFSLFSIPTKLYLINSHGLETMIIGQAIIYLTITSISYGIIFRKKLFAIIF
jgi:O-antigen/teichoic acid export membrane protein